MTHSSLAQRLQKLEAAIDEFEGRILEQWEKQMVQHTFQRCRGEGCSGCHTDGADCVFDVLDWCHVCGGAEGNLLPECPGYTLTQEQHEQNYLSNGEQMNRRQNHERT